MRNRAIAGFLVLLFPLASVQGRQELDLSGPYLGQEAPGTTPELFLPELFEEDVNEGGATFSWDGLIFAFRQFIPDKTDPLPVWVYEEKDGIWIGPVRAGFDSGYQEWDFNFDRSGNRFFFTSDRPAMLEGKTADNSNIWLVHKEPEGWTEPELLPSPVNTVKGFSGYPSISCDGRICFHSNRDGGLGHTDLYLASPVEASGYEVVNIGKPVNSAWNDLDPSIAPDGTYLIFMSTRPSEVSESGDMYVSFLDDSGLWRNPISLRSIVGEAGHPCISADGKFFFFTREIKGQTDIFWISTEVILRLK